MLTVPRPGHQQEKGRRPSRKKGLSVLMGPPPAPTPAPSRKRVSQVVRRHSETCAPSLVVREKYSLKPPPPLRASTRKRGYHEGRESRSVLRADGAASGTRPGLRRPHSGR